MHGIGRFLDHRRPVISPTYTGYAKPVVTAMYCSPRNDNNRCNINSIWQIYFAGICFKSVKVIGPVELMRFHLYA